MLVAMVCKQTPAATDQKRPPDLLQLTLFSLSAVTSSTNSSITALFHKLWSAAALSLCAKQPLLSFDNLC